VRVRRGHQAVFVGKGKVESKHITMEVFDTLPARIRRAMQEADFNYVTSSVALLLIQGTEEERIIARLRKSDLAEREARAMAEIWGATGHPQAIIQGPTAEDMGL
jgi:hypothetical protein